jgi:NTP pyrophosphatase (non-canonical NTP hydrolase)
MKHAFIETRARQEGYVGKPIAYDEAEAKECMQNAILEIAEASTLFPRKWHKSPAPLDQWKLLEELADVILFVFAACSWLGISYEELEQAIISKLAYNKTRKEHKI